jgi:hypothetical protein
LLKKLEDQTKSINPENIFKEDVQKINEQNIQRDIFAI